MVKQVGSAWKKVFRLSLPDDVVRKATAAVNPANIAQLVFRRSAGRVDASVA
jgi:NADPH-dependent stearoyl-CoA 9-desaturase